MKNFVRVSILVGVLAHSNGVAAQETFKDSLLLKEPTATKGIWTEALAAEFQKKAKEEAALVGSQGFLSVELMRLLPRRRGKSFSEFWSKQVEGGAPLWMTEEWREKIKGVEDRDGDVYPGEFDFDFRVFWVNLPAKEIFGDAELPDDLKMTGEYNYTFSIRDDDDQNERSGYAVDLLSSSSQLTAREPVISETESYVRFRDRVHALPENRFDIESSVRTRIAALDVRSRRPVVDAAFLAHQLKATMRLEDEEGEVDRGQVECLEGFIVFRSDGGAEFIFELRADTPLNFIGHQYEVGSRFELVDEAGTRLVLEIDASGGIQSQLVAP